MGDTGELIVEFRPGTSEDDARKLVEGLGAKVRRKMRSDADKVMLLVRLEGAKKSSFESSPLVSRTEPNDDSYGVR
jgi:hypothetical protein